MQRRSPSSSWVPHEGTAVDGVPCRNEGRVEAGCGVGGLPGVPGGPPAALFDRLRVKPDHLLRWAPDRMRRMASSTVRPFTAPVRSSCNPPPRRTRRAGATPEGAPVERPQGSARQDARLSERPARRERAGGARPEGEPPRGVQFTPSAERPLTDPAWRGCRTRTTADRSPALPGPSNSSLARAAGKGGMQA